MAQWRSANDSGSYTETKSTGTGAAKRLLPLFIYVGWKAIRFFKGHALAKRARNAGCHQWKRYHIRIQGAIKRMAADTRRKIKTAQWTLYFKSERRTLGSGLF